MVLGLFRRIPVEWGKQPQARPGILNQRLSWRFVTLETKQSQLVMIADDNIKFPINIAKVYPFR